MPNWEIPSYDSEPLQPGKFYNLYVNKDNATLTVAKDIQDTINAQVTTNKNSIEGLDSAVQALQTKEVQNEAQIEDNTARINNLENEDLRTKLLIAMELATIRKNFTNTREIEIEYGRREIISIKVYIVKEATDQKIIYQESSSTLLVENVVDLNSSGIPTIKKIVIKSNTPISGYCLIL